MATRITKAGRITLAVGALAIAFVLGAVVVRTSASVIPAPIDLAAVPDGAAARGRDDGFGLIDGAEPVDILRPRDDLGDDDGRTRVDVVDRDTGTDGDRAATGSDEAGDRTAPSGSGSGSIGSPRPVPVPVAPSQPSPPSPSTPAVTVPGVTGPALPLTPPTTVPGITLPGVTLPGVTVPGVTVPGLTVPPIDLPGLDPPLTLPVDPSLPVPTISVPPLSLPAVTIPPLPLIEPGGP